VDWPARFARLGDGIDPLTRTVDVVVVVDNPYGQAVPGQRPPLTKGMFVEVELRGPLLTPVAVVPRAALLEGMRVHLAGPDDRLETRQVEVGIVQNGFATITRGLSPGERVVVSDLIPAVEGMRLAPVRDEAAEKALATASAGASAGAEPRL
jgi:multidrug efflux pump subunit AcrA (membrane-fusion protein)